MQASTRLAGKRCLITGAAAGIGRASAIAFANAGATVLAIDINASALGSLAAEHSAIETSVLDVTNPEQIATLVQLHPNVDVLFNCAGFVHAGDILHTEALEWRRTFTVNVDSMFYLCKAVIPGMVQQLRGNIINMASVASSVKSVQNRFAYSASKAAVIGLTKSIAADYVASGLRCNAICPGTVNTPSLAQRIAAFGGDPKSAWQSFIGRQPMGRLGEAYEIAALAVYLASDESAFTTGAIHVIDGGWSN